MNREIKIRYFASLSEALGIREELWALNQTPITCADLKQYLIARGDRWQVLSDNNLRIAANHQLVDDSYVIASGDEIAIFPPVTGG